MHTPTTERLPPLPSARRVRADSVSEHASRTRVFTLDSISWTSFFSLSSLLAAFLAASLPASTLSSFVNSSTSASAPASSSDSSSTSSTAPAFVPHP